MTFKLGAMT